MRCSRGCETQSRCPVRGARATSTPGPVQERVYARHAGLGWIGKNTCVINPRGRLVDLSVGDHLQPAARGGRARPRSVRRVHVVHRGVPHARARRAGRARLDALHFVSDDRAAGAHSRRVRRRRRFPRLRLRRLPGSLSLESGRPPLQRSRLAAAAGMGERGASRRSRR